ncbi:MAG: amidophosphoribosyltransferase, partial [Lachnospiraceae bacterium]|nr:amidophosphoribosyltransferase [Lachnospiraceae bacterium]
TVGKINNMDELCRRVMERRGIHFQQMSSGEVNATEMVASLIDECENLVEGLQNAQRLIDGSMTILLLTPKGIYLARDRYGRTPLVIGRKENGFCASFESFAYLNLGYADYRELGPGEIAVMTPEGVTSLVKPGEKMRICTFLWVYYGYPSSSYEGVSVEEMRMRCGSLLAKRDGLNRVAIDAVAGVPDSGTAHAIGYANESGIPFTRPFIKYTPTWPRSFMPTIQTKRDLIARMKLIPVHNLIEDKRLLLIDDSIVRGTQLRDTTEYLYHAGAKEVHVRPACPPILYGCKYINFSRSTSEMELFARRVIHDLEGGQETQETVSRYADPDTPEYAQMVEEIGKRQNFTTLRYNRLDDMLAAVGMPEEKLCTYCWTGRE